MLTLNIIVLADQADYFGTLNDIKSLIIFLGRSYNNRFLKHCVLIKLQDSLILSFLDWYRTFMSIQI